MELVFIRLMCKFSPVYYTLKYISIKLSNCQSKYDLKLLKEKLFHLPTVWKYLWGN